MNTIDLKNYVLNTQVKIGDITVNGLGNCLDGDQPDELSDYGFIFVDTRTKKFGWALIDCCGEGYGMHDDNCQNFIRMRESLHHDIDELGVYSGDSYRIDVAYYKDEVKALDTDLRKQIKLNKIHI